MNAPAAECSAAGAEMTSRSGVGVGARRHTERYRSTGLQTMFAFRVVGIACERT
jgi:hypothetical protein